MAFLDVLERLGRGVWSLRQSRTGYVILWILVVVFLSKAALDSYADYESLQVGVEWSMLTLSFLVLMVRSLLTPVKWDYMLRLDGPSLGYLEISRIFYISQLSSYIPGGLWQYLDFFYRASESGKAIETVTDSIIYIHGTNIAAGLTYAVLAFGLYSQAYLIPAVLFASVMLAGTLYSPAVIRVLKNPLKSLGLSVGGRTPRKRELSVLFALAFGIWIIKGVVLYTLVLALYPAGGLFLPISAAMAVAWAAGFLVLFMPGGLGVREGVMVFLLSSVVPLPIAIAASVISRVFSLLAEVVMASLFAGIAYIRGG